MTETLFIMLFFVIYEPEYFQRLRFFAEVVFLLPL